MPPGINYRDRILSGTINSIKRLIDGRHRSNKIDVTYGQSVLRICTRIIKEYHNLNIPDESFKILCQANYDCLILSGLELGNKNERIERSIFLTMLERITESMNSKILQIEDPK